MRHEAKKLHDLCLPMNSSKVVNLKNRTVYQSMTVEAFSFCNSKCKQEGTAASSPNCNDDCRYYQHIMYLLAGK